MRHRTPVRTAFAAIVAIMIWCCLAVAAMAHASLTAVVPADGAVVGAPPRTLSLSFSEPVSPLVLRLVLPDGQAADLDRFVLRDRTLEITPPAALGSGTYVLTWRVISEDGHPVGGSTIFSIGAPSAAPPSADETADWSVRGAIWTARVVLYVGLFFGIGGVFAACWLTPSERGGPRGLSAAVVIAFLASALSVWLQGLDALGLPITSMLDPAVWRAGFATSFGMTVIVLPAAFLLALVAGRLASTPLARSLSVTALVAGGLALALSGHASTAAPQWLARPAVFLHAMTIAIWVGALLPLAWALRHDPAVGRAGLQRFSRLIPWAVAILVLAGGFLAVIQVHEPASLLTTAYGRVLLVKLGLLILLFGLVGVNRWILTKPVAEGEGNATRRLVRSIAVETLIVVTIFAVAATWRFTPPPRALAVAVAQPLSTHIHSDKAMAEVTITPAKAGLVVASAFILGPDFTPLDPKEVTFVFSNAEAGVEPMRRKAVLGDDGNWRAEALVIPLAGKWTMRINVLISDFELVRLEEVIDIKP